MFTRKAVDDRMTVIVGNMSFVGHLELIIRIFNHLPDFIFKAYELLFLLLQ